MISVQRAIPLRISLDRAWIYGACCALLVSVPFLAGRWFTQVAYKYDFACFWSAGATVGTRTLTDPNALNEWAHRHGMIAQPFSYLPAFAWFYAPFRTFSPPIGLAIDELAMVALFVAAALLAARVYGYDPRFCVAATFAWAPAVNSIEVGQSTGLALALTVATTAALLERRDALAGLAAGLLLYKPTVALPMLLLLLVTRRWRALGAWVVCAAGWYFLSVAAAGNDWQWPLLYAHTMAWWVPMDFLAGSAKAFSVPTLLMAGGVGPFAAIAVAVAIWLIALPAAVRAPLIETASLLPLVGLAAALHAWPYEAALALPAIFYAMRALPEPLRTALVAFVYAATAVLMVTRYGTLALFAVCAGGSAWWLWSAYRHGIMTRWSLPPAS